MSHALKDALGDYEWNVKDSSELRRKHTATAGNSGALCAAARKSSVVVIVSPCPRDGGEGLAEFLGGGGGGTGGETGVLCAGVDGVMRRKELGEAFKQRGLILQVWTALHLCAPHSIYNCVHRTLNLAAKLPASQLLCAQPWLPCAPNLGYHAPHPTLATMPPARPSPSTTPHRSATPVSLT